MSMQSLRACAPCRPRIPSAGSERRRYTSEARATIRYPIVPVGDSIQSNVVEEAGVRRVAYPLIGWQLAHPAPAPGGKFPSSAVLEVYIALIFLFRLAGMPEHGRIYFSKYQLMLLMGWLSTSAGPHGQSVSKPSGRHYRQLEAALEYLDMVRFRSESAHEWQMGPDGALFKGKQSFGILQYNRLVADQPGSAEGEDGGATSMVALSWAFMQLLAAEGEGVPMDYDLFLSLPSGTPRHLLRMLSWMRQEGLTRIRVREAFERVGSTQTAYLPTRARQILGKGHQELIRRGLLASEPEYVKDRATSEYWIEYTWGDPGVLLSEEEMLVRQATAYGVVQSTARELVVASRDQVERVLAAITLGLLQPKSSIPGLIVKGVRKGYEIHDFGRRIEDEDQISLEFELPEMRYIRWTAEERAVRLAERPDVCGDEIRREVEAQNALRSEPHPEWVLEGLTAMRLNHLLGVEDFALWRASARAAQD
jgi:hypothetical protein